MFSDITSSAVELAAYNTKIQLKKFNKPNLKIIKRVGNGLSVLASPFTLPQSQQQYHHPNNKMFDLIISTPPYIPMFQRSLPITSPVEGTGLLQEIIRHFSHFSNELILGISHIAEPDLHRTVQLLKDLNDIRLNVTCLNGDGFWAPFRIPWIEQDHLDQLVKERNLSIGPPPNEHSRGLKYWHKIKVFSITCR